MMKSYWPRTSFLFAITIGLLVAGLPARYALAASRIFNLHLVNGTSQAVTFTISRGTNHCYEGTPGLGTVLPTLQPGQHTTMQLARVQGHDCGGENGVFALEISGQPEHQIFQYDNEGTLAMYNFPSAYLGHLSDKSEEDESYTWTFKDPDPRVKHTDTFRLRHAVSGSYLIQGYRADRDDKRNVEAQPYENHNPNNYRWFVDFVPFTPGRAWFYIINLHTGLVLTQDSVIDRNVSNWGRDNSRQYWEYVQNGDKVMLVNAMSGMGLTQHDGGSDAGEPNVTVWPGQNWSHPGWTWIREDAGKADLCKLTIEKIKCIKPSTGKDIGTKFLFAAIEFSASLATGGSTAGLSAGSIAAKEAIKQAAKAGLKTGLTQAAKSGAKKAGEVLTRKIIVNIAAQKAAATAIKKASLAAANEVGDTSADSFVELAFDHLYGESPDQLEIRVNNKSVWPNGGRDWRDIKSQQTLDVYTEFVFLRQQGAAIQLIEYDHGSGDDSLGWLTLDTREVITKETYEEVIIRNKDEGSIYAITFSVQPFELRRPKAKVIPPGLEWELPGTYRRVPLGDDWGVGYIGRIHDKLHWINKAGASWSLTLYPEDLKLVTGSDNPLDKDGVHNFNLIVNDGKYRGFQFGDQTFVKISSHTLPDMIGSYERQPVQNGTHVGSINPAGTGLNWSNADGTSWNLTEAFDQDKLATGSDNPYYDSGATEFKITKPVLDKDGIIDRGFVFGGEYYRRISSYTPAMMVGQYQHRNANPGTGMHYGFINLMHGRLSWITRDGKATWSLKPDFKNRRLLLGDDSPFKQFDGFKEFTLRMNNSGQVLGFKFGQVGEFDRVPEITNDMIIGNYQHVSEQGPEFTGSIQMTKTGLRWINKAGQSWGLEADYANNQLITNVENPKVEIGVYQYKLIIINGEYKGFQFGVETYHRK